MLTAPASWITPAQDTTTRRELGGTRNPQGWQDAIIDGPIPENRNETMHKKLLPRWRTRLSEAECRRIAYAQGAEWKYDEIEYKKLDDQITRIYAKDAIYEVPENDVPDTQGESSDLPPIPTFNAFMERFKNPTRDREFMPTGPTKSLDDALSGYLRKWLYVIIAETRVGKTILQGLQSRSLAETREVVMIEREMTADQLWIRLIAAEANVSALRLTEEYRGKDALGTLGWNVVGWAADKLRSLKLTIYGNDYPLDLGQWDNVLRVLDRHPDAAVLHYDIFQRLRAPGDMEPGRFEADAKIHGLKQLAVDRNIAVGVTCHPSRPIKTALEHAAGASKIWYPSVHSGLESNQIEGTADAIILLARHTDSKIKEERSDLKWKIAKNRDGFETPWATWKLDLRSMRINDTKESVDAVKEAAGPKEEEGAS